jgi:phosphatidylglycerophosphate synthase
MPLKITRHYAVTDSPVLDRWVHRPLAGRLTRLLLRIPLGPNPVTVLSGLVGLAAAWAFAQGGAGPGVGGLGLYLGSVVLDHCDGEIARATGRASRAGRWLDIGMDCAVHAAVVLGLAAGSGAPGLLPWGMAGGIGVALAGLVVFAYPPPATPHPPRAGAGPASPGLALLASRDGFYALIAAALLLRGGPAGALRGLFALLAVGGNLFWVAWLAGEARRPA